MCSTPELMILSTMVKAYRTVTVIGWLHRAPFLWPKQLLYMGTELATLQLQVQHLIAKPPKPLITDV